MQVLRQTHYLHFYHATFETCLCIGKTLGNIIIADIVKGNVPFGEKY